MASWGEFAAAAPRLAGRARALLEQYGPGLAYLATIRSDGGPRVHPVAPVIAGDGLFCFLLRSPKRRDLERDGRYALHSFPPELTDDEAYLAGRASPVRDSTRAAELARRFSASGQVDWRLFELSVEVAMVGHPSPPTPAGTLPAAGYRPGPTHQVWRANQPVRHAPAPRASPVATG
ncbi:pyridoxamine 5'-phosphate oxidase family protein [Natronosporangium hydrolyticum]|uniref:pyridoxamine 5'-phosphate oxidase family protein n=1 Tax=Natronosporangium hydrolyticum TaxID=2811111 RepID=UPI001EFA2A83|nr:pyridoxamine 5'-phosphate oxidase family protein [Natronosporangium hydrolyticum]